MAGMTRRDFAKGLVRSGIGACVLGKLAPLRGENQSPSRIYRVDQCPLHDNQLRHVGVDTLLDLLADDGLRFYRSPTRHPWAAPTGIISSNDIVIIKVNCQWRARGATNTDVVRGVIHRVLQHPDGFGGEVVIMENGQGRGGFDGITNGGTNYSAWPELKNVVAVNAEEPNLLSVNYLVDTVFSGKPVSSFLLDGIRGSFISSTEHAANGYRKINPPAGSSTMTPVSYPCFTTARGNRIELREGRWTGSGYASNVRLINIPVLKDHSGSGMTGVLKHCYGILSMSDGQSSARHYSEIGSQCGKMWSMVRTPDLNILDCIWVSHQALAGYPGANTRRCNILLAGLDPVAMDYYASKHILLPLGGSLRTRHDPDEYSGLSSMLSGARHFINTNGGIGGSPAQSGDANIEVVTRSVRTGVAVGWGDYL